MFYYNTTFNSYLSKEADGKIKILRITIKIKKSRSQKKVRGRVHSQ